MFPQMRGPGSQWAGITSHHKEMKQKQLLKDRYFVVTRELKHYLTQNALPPGGKLFSCLLALASPSLLMLIVDLLSSSSFTVQERRLTHGLPATLRSLRWRTQPQLSRKGLVPVVLSVTVVT